jgi:hypothetical protein
MTGTDWGDEQPADDAHFTPAAGDDLSGAQQPETMTFGSETGTRAQRHSRRRLVTAVSSAAAVVVVVVVVLLFTIGSGQTPAQAVASAVRQTTGYKTIVASLSETVSGPSSASVSGKVTVQRSPLLMSVNIAENASGEHIPVSAILTGKAMYLKVGIPIGLPASESGKWLEITYARLGSTTLSSLLHTIQSENPASQVQALLAAKGVHDDGTQTVGGVQATKYTGSFLPSAAIKLLPASERSAFSPVLKEMTGDVAFSLWINGGEVLKVTEVEHVSSSTLTVSIRYLSYNQPVKITVPSGSQVYEPPASAFSAGT